MPYADFVEWALYDEADGFYSLHGQAGRRGDFLTSAEVGPLFGAVVARALDTWWKDLGSPDPYVVVDAGAGPGTLARAMVAAAPECVGALRLVLVERSARQRERHPSFVTSQAELPAMAHVIVANELLDNIPFDLLVFDDGWRDAWVAQGNDGQLVEVLRPAVAVPTGAPVRPVLGARLPRQDRAVRWVDDAIGRLVPGGRLVVVDYSSTTAAMAQRPWRDWLRTYRGHERGAHPLRQPGTQDITVEVALDQLATPTSITTQAQWLALHGIAELVDEGKSVWADRAGIGDLAALKARSRVREAEALCDPAGLGGFTIAEWNKAR